MRAVVKLIAERTGAASAKPTGMRFQRVDVAGHAAEVIISSEQIGTATGIGKSAAYRAVLSALDLGFLVNNEFRRSKPFRLVLKKGVDEVEALAAPEPADAHHGKRGSMIGSFQAFRFVSKQGETDQVVDNTNEKVSRFIVSPFPGGAGRCISIRYRRPN